VPLMLLLAMTMAVRNAVIRIPFVLTDMELPNAVQTKTENRLLVANETDVFASILLVNNVVVLESMMDSCVIQIKHAVDQFLMEPTLVVMVELFVMSLANALPSLTALPIKLFAKLEKELQDVARIALQPVSSA